MKLVEFVAKKTGLGKRQAKVFLANGQVFRNRLVCCDGSIEVQKFDCIQVAGKILSSATPRYVLLNKPSGVVSATTDALHETVIDLVKEPWAKELHLAGRLDRFTTGLIILTNDSVFSRYLSHPNSKIPKTYLVSADQLIDLEMIRAFEAGMYFAKEKIYTQPAKLTQLSAQECRLTIYEGKHHQIKRMFLHFGIRVTKLHREVIGNYVLPEDLEPGAYRCFQPEVSDHSLSY